MDGLIQYVPWACGAIFLYVYWGRIAAAFIVPAEKPVPAPTPTSEVVSEQLVERLKSAIAVEPNKPKDTICDINRHVEALIEDARTRGDQELIDHLLAYLRGRVSVAKGVKAGS